MTATRVSLGVLAVGLLTTLFGVLLRVLEVGRQLDVRGFTVTYRYPAAAGLVLAGLALAAGGLIAFLICLARHRGRPAS